MRDYGEAIAKDTVRIERLLPGPIERVWAYLTESEKRGQWLASGEMEMRVGGKVQLRFLHSSLSPHQEPTPERFKNMACGVGFDGAVIQCEPPRLLAYTWGGDTSEVKFELAPQGTQVLLVITHTRLRDRDEMVNVAAGWHAHVGIMEDNLREQTPRPFWSTWQRLEKEYKRRLAATAEINMFKGINVVSISVTDLDEARHFYRDILKLGEPIYDLPEVGWTEFGSGGLSGNIAVTRSEEDWKPNRGTRIVLNVDDCEASCEKLRRRGVRCEDPQVFPGYVIFCSFYDPFGNRLQMCSPAPDARDVES